MKSHAHAHALLFTGILLLTSCASIDFGGDGLTYYDPKPYLFVSISDNCVSTVTVINVPGEKKSMKFNSGYGSSDLTATFSNGMVSNVGQKTDTKIPETITAISGLGTAAAQFRRSSGERIAGCPPKATLYPIIDGIPDYKNPINFPMK